MSAYAGGICWPVPALASAASPILVATNPGSMMTTLMPNPATSWRRASDSASTAYLVALHLGAAKDLDRPGQGEPGAVDQHIDAGPAGGSFDLGPGMVHRALVGHIQADGLDVRCGGGQAGQHPLPACRGKDQMPLPGELGRRRPSDS